MKVKHKVWHEPNLSSACVARWETSATAVRWLVQEPVIHDGHQRLLSRGGEVQLQSA